MLLMQASCSRVRAVSRSKQRLSWTLRIALLCGTLALLAPSVAGVCPVPVGANKDFIDENTPAAACTKQVCVASYEECCGSNPDMCKPQGSTEKLQLVFSDEFLGYQRNTLGSITDKRWTAMDYHYSSNKNEWQNYKPEYVEVKDGKLLLTLDDKPSSAVRHGAQFDDVVSANKTSGMVQSWNKFCFTGGLIEFSVKLPGNSSQSGYWAATWLMGNLGRAGYYPSLEGMWPFSYDDCANGDQAFDWNDNKTQRISRCRGIKGRGAPEIDVLEYGLMGAQRVPQFVHTMQMAPVAPPYTSWMNPDPKTGHIPGIKLAGKDDPRFKTHLGTSYSQVSKDGFPRTGSGLTDTYTGSSDLTASGETYWETHHTYSVLWEPGEYVRWYLDDELLFEVNKEALREQTNANGTTVKQRLIPYEPSYIVMNLAMSNNAWAAVAYDLQYPGVMSVDHVRIWQRPGSINVGCDPKDFPTAQYISCNRQLYLGAGERGAWKFPYCRDIRSQENQFLLGFAGTTVVVVITTVVLMLWMHNAFSKERELSKQVGRQLPGITPGTTSESKIKDCYINKGGRDLEELLKHTRPDLLAVAKLSAKANQD